VLDAYMPLGAFSALQEQLNQLDLDTPAASPVHRDPVLLRVVDEPWPFPANYQLAAQPLAALDLLDHPDPVAQHIGCGVLQTLAEVAPTVLARHSARGRARSGPLLRNVAHAGAPASGTATGGRR
jgi:hypothetical protein